MSIVVICSTLGLSVFMFLLGFIAKKKWLKIATIIPLAIFLYPLVRLLGFLNLY